MKTTLACMALLAFGAFTAVTLAQPPEGGPPDGPPPGHRDGPQRDRLHGSQDGPPPLPPLMKALDADGDRTISAEEIAGASEALKTLDKNDDGKLDAEEIRPPHPPRPPRGLDGRPDARRGRGHDEREEFGPPPGGPHARRGGPDEFERGPRGRGPDGPGPDEFVRRPRDRGPERRGPGADEHWVRGPAAGGPPPFLPPHLRDELDLSEDQLQQMEEVHKEAREKIEKILTEEQREKLKDFGPPRGPRED
jgi:hypothetical protein